MAAFFRPVVAGIAGIAPRTPGVTAAVDIEGGKAERGTWKAEIGGREEFAEAIVEEEEEEDEVDMAMPEEILIPFYHTFFPPIPAPLYRDSPSELHEIQMQCLLAPIEFILLY